MQENYFTKETLKAALEAKGITTNAQAQPVIDAMIKKGAVIQGINEPQSTLDKAKDVAVGFGKGVGRTVVGAAQGLQEIGTVAMHPSILVGGMPAGNKSEGFDTLKQGSPENTALNNTLQSTNDSQKLGGQIETGAELLAGGGAGLIKDTVTGGAKLIGKGASPILNSVKPVGEYIYSKAFTPSVKEAENILAYEATKPSIASKIYGAGALEGNPAFKPITTAETALRSGISGTEKQVGVQAKQVADTLWNKEIAPAVKGIKETITKEELFAPLKERIAKIVDPTKKQAYQNAFDSLAEDYAKTKSFTYEQAQALKSELAQFTPAKVFRGQDVANETRMLQADMASTIRQKTYDKLKDINVRQKYIDYGNLQELQKVGVKAISEAGTKGGFGGFWSTVYNTAMTPVKTIGGKILYHIGDKLQVTAPKGFEGKSFADYLRSIGYLAPQVANDVLKDQQPVQK